jgi:predicted CXXCH cytochrome family protein
VLPEVEEECVECHEPVLEQPQQGKLHEPVREKQCLTCHAVHQSPLENLIKPVGEKMCNGCHDPQEFNTPDHPTVYRADCLICHAGHHSPRPDLLREDTRAVARRGDS